MNTALVKTIGNIAKNEEALAILVPLTAAVAPHIKEMLDNTTDKAIEFANNVMDKGYRFKAGPIVLEPASTKITN